MSGYSYEKGVTTGRPMALLWNDRSGTAIDFSSGWTFTVRLVAASTPTVLAATKTTGITGYADNALGYNILIDWATADFTALTGGTSYTVKLVATPTSGDPIAFPGPASFYLEAAPVAP